MDGLYRGNNNTGYLGDYDYLVTEETEDLYKKKKIQEWFLLCDIKNLETQIESIKTWNKRATVFYLIGEFKKSQDDIDKVLAIEARHFGALAGQGLVNIQLKNYEKAILSYEQAKEIHPSMQSPEIMIRQIEELIKQQSI